MIELGTRSGAIVSAVSLSLWRGRAGPLPRWQRTEGRSRRRNWHPDRHWRPRNSSKRWNAPAASAERTRKSAGAPGEIRTPDLLFRSYSWPNWPGLEQGVSGCKYQIGERFSPLPTTPSKQVVATVSATVVPGSPPGVGRVSKGPNLFRPEVLASRSGGGRISRDGTHAPEKFETMVPPRWELYG
jgi:hypothetical protein